MSEDNDFAGEQGIKKAFINAEIIEESGEAWAYDEGCLSIPERRDSVNRGLAILIEYDKLDGSHHFEMVEDFTAVIFQHEIDHLNGILFLDHLDEEIKAAEDSLKLSQHRNGK